MAIKKNLKELPPLTDETFSNLKTKVGGRKKGQINIATKARDQVIKRLVDQCGMLMAKEVQHVVKVVLEKAKEGDLQAAKLVMDRVIPANKFDQVKQSPTVQIIVEQADPAKHGSGVVINQSEEIKDG